LLPTDEEARNAILEALYEEKRCGHGGLEFEQLRDKLYIPWPILWFNLDYLAEENLILHQKRENSTGGDSLPPTYVISEKGEKVMERKEDYTEEYPFLTMCTDDFDE
jgi:hypothetical protein